jgi:Fungal trichothecene efflux pump (TRI12)
MFTRDLFANSVLSSLLKLTSQRVTVLTLFIGAVAGANYWSLVAFWPLECQILYGPDAMKVAIDVLPFAFSTSLGVIVVNMCISWFKGSNRELLLVCSCMMTAGVGGLASVTQYTPGLGMGLSFLGGVGIGGATQPTATMLSVVSPDELIATITAATISVRLIGATIGYAVYFNVLQNSLADMHENIAVVAMRAGLSFNETDGFITALLGNNETILADYSTVLIAVAQTAIKDTYVEGFKRVYLVSISFGASAIIACLFLGDIKTYMVDRIAVDIH